MPSWILIVKQVYGQTCRSTRTRFPESETTSLYSFMLHAQRGTSKYQFYSFFFNPNPRSTTLYSKFREPQHINWKHNSKIIMDAVEDYARRWIKREVDQDPELESLSDWVRTIRSLVQGRIQKNSKIVLIVDLSLYLKTKKLLSVFPLFMTNMLSFLRTRLPTISYLYVNHITSNV